MPLPTVTDGVQAYRITLSPKGDIDPEAEKKFVKWVSKAEMVYCVAEHGVNNQRHIHALVLYDTKKQKAVLQNYIWQNQIKPYHPESIQKYAVVVTAAYNLDWRTSYLQKENDAEVLLDKWDSAHALKYLPTVEEQNALADAKGCVRMGRAQHDQKMWADMAAFFKVWFTKEHTGPGWTIGANFELVTPAHCLEFLNVEMLHGRMVAMVDTRRRIEKAIWLYRVVTKNSKPTDGEKQIIDKWQNGHQLQ